MRIYFGYITGINRIDTPYFSSISQQSTWFSNKSIGYVDTTFYPPHYTNRIRVSTEDLDFNKSCNYVWFEYNGKTYYYFIDEITYINETLIEILITMDYIQTYYFNIIVSNGIIERKFINRWVNVNNQWCINRNYIRVSDHVANNYSYTRASDTSSALVYSQYLDPNDGNAGNNTGTSNSTFTDSQVYYIVVWLSENGHNQTTGATNDASHGGNASTTANNFFNGSVTFISAQGSEVTATFFGHTRVTPTY